MGLSAKTDKDFFELCNKYLENTEWEEIIAQYRPFCNFLWCFGAKMYYNLHDHTSVFSDLNFLVTLFQNFLVLCCKM